MDRRPVRRVEFDPPDDFAVPPPAWPWSLPPVRQLVADGLDLAPMHGFFSYLETNPNRSSGDPDFHEMSHGESFLALLGLGSSRP
ncbi:hypothetical protein [Jiangella gansuensis]|uniref:hypothetical protein n=1 Tax=Jiangella gansuensis TaxID=281473 RepID=UPI00047E838C|nr:hypothetical protein [Jiangella gansuensis]